jgi:hypothetical protein
MVCFRLLPYPLVALLPDFAFLSFFKEEADFAFLLRRID